MTEDEIQKMGAIARTRIEEVRKKLEKQQARAIVLEEKQQKILQLSRNISLYSLKLDSRTDIGTCTNQEFERHMRSRNRIDRAFVKIAALSVRYNVSALKNLTVNIGSEFLIFSVWGELEAIPFTLEDENLLVWIKTQSVEALISALRRVDRVTYAIEHIVGGSYLDGDAIRTLKQSSAVQLANAAARALWIDFEVLAPKYFDDRALSLKLDPSLKSFHKQREPGDNTKVTTIRVNTYNNFAQRLHGFSPIPYQTFPIFISTPIPPEDVI